MVITLSAIGVIAWLCVIMIMVMPVSRLVSKEFKNLLACVIVKSVGGLIAQAV